MSNLFAKSVRYRINYFIKMRVQLSFLIFIIASFTADKQFYWKYSGSHRIRDKFLCIFWQPDINLYSLTECIAAFVEPVSECYTGQ